MAGGSNGGMDGRRYATRMMTYLRTICTLAAKPELHAILRQCGVDAVVMMVAWRKR